jgi:hypothetical protein
LATPIVVLEKAINAPDGGSTAVVPEQIGVQCSGSTAAVTASTILLDRPSRPVLIGENPKGVIYSSAAEQF